MTKWINCSWMNDWIYAIEWCTNVAWGISCRFSSSSILFVFGFILLFFELWLHVSFWCSFLSIVGCTAPNSNSSIPCNGHGKCETKENGQNCMCYYGFTGPYCEHSKCFVFESSTITRFDWHYSLVCNEFMVQLIFYRRFKWLLAESMQK